MRPEQHPASNSTARKAHAEATVPDLGIHLGDRIWQIPGPGPIAAELERLHRIGQSRRDEISDDDWAWFCAHPLQQSRVQWGEVIPVLLAWIRQRGGEGPSVSCAGRGGDVEVIDVESLAEKWESASMAARRSEHHWPADCLAEAAATVRQLAAELTATLAAQPAAPQPTEGGALTEAEQTSLHYSQANHVITWTSLFAVVERIKADAYAAGLEAVLSEQARQRFLTEPVAHAQRPEGVTVTEHGVDVNGQIVGPIDGWDGYRRGELAATHTRQRTTFPDVVTEWAEAGGDDDAELVDRGSPGVRRWLAYQDRRAAGGDR